MFEKFVDSQTPPRFRSMWLSVSLHGAAMAVVVLIRLATAAQFSLIPVVHAAGVELISPPEMDRLIVAQPMRRNAKVESSFSPAGDRVQPLREPTEIPPVAAATVVDDKIVVPSDTMEPGSFPTANLLIMDARAGGVADPVIAKPIAPEPVADTVPNPPRVELPTVLSRVAPEYPEVARSARVQGAVELEGVVNADGHVGDIRVLSGHPLLVDAAVACVRKWRYSPAQINGHIVPAPVRITVRFHLTFH